MSAVASRFDSDPQSRQSIRGFSTPCIFYSIRPFLHHWNWTSCPWLNRLDMFLDETMKSWDLRPRCHFAEAYQNSLSFGSSFCLTIWHLIWLCSAQNFPVQCCLVSSPRIVNSRRLGAIGITFRSEKKKLPEGRKNVSPNPHWLHAWSAFLLHLWIHLWYESKLFFCSLIRNSEIKVN